MREFLELFKLLHCVPSGDNRVQRFSGSLLIVAELSLVSCVVGSSVFLILEEKILLNNYID
jgi:hypothetical protein